MEDLSDSTGQMTQILKTLFEHRVSTQQTVNNNAGQHSAFVDNTRYVASFTPDEQALIKLLFGMKCYMTN